MGTLGPVVCPTWHGDTLIPWLWQYRYTPGYLPIFRVHLFQKGGAMYFSCSWHYTTAQKEGSRRDKSQCTWWCFLKWPWRFVYWFWNCHLPSVSHWLHCLRSAAHGLYLSLSLLFAFIFYLFGSFSTSLNFKKNISKKCFWNFQHFPSSRFNS